MSYTELPSDLPAPTDDGAADHLVGLRIPGVELASTDGASVSLDQLANGRIVLYLYPLTGRPGVDLPDGWDAIPGARGCTPEACGFRDHHAELGAVGAHDVYGISSQDPAYQAEVHDRLGLTFALLSDPSFELASALRLPTFQANGQRLYSRLTMVAAGGLIEHVFYPVFPPDQHAGHVVSWLSGRTAEQAEGPSR